MTKSHSFSLILCCLCTLTFNIQAQSFFDSFDVANQPLAGTSDWTSTSGTANSIGIVGNQVVLLSSGVEEAVETLDLDTFSVPDLPSIYLGLNVLQAGNTSTSGFTYFLRTDSTGGAFQNRLFATESGAAVDSYRLGLRFDSSGATVGAFDLSYAITYQVELDISGSSTTVNVRDASGSSLIGSFSDSGGTVSDVDEVVLRQDADLGTNANIRIEYLGVDAIPEPTALNLCLTLLGLSAWRRMRRVA